MMIDPPSNKNRRRLSSNATTALLWLVILILLLLLWSLFRTIPESDRLTELVKLLSAAAAVGALEYLLFRFHDGTFYQGFIRNAIQFLVRPFSKKPPDILRISTVADLFVAQRARTLVRSLVLLLCVSAMTWRVISKPHTGLSRYHLIVLLVLGALAVMNYGVLWFRVAHGRFGESERELRELARFILANSSNDDFRGPGGHLRELLHSRSSESTSWVNGATGAES